MLDLGTVRPGSTIRIPFSSFDKDDGSSITMTNYAAADILIYKDGSTTERASTAGFTATTDFDTKTGKHLAVIDLADNTTAGFFAAGSEYVVAIDSVTVDAVTTGGWIARFRIGYPSAWFDTTIATLASQTSFTLTVGPAEDDALNGCRVIIHDVASSVQCGQAVILDYTGSTKTVTLVAGTTFTAAASDNISIMWPQPLQPTVTGRTLDVTATGAAGIDWANVENPTTAVNLSGTNIDTDQVVASVTGAVGSVTGAVGSVTGNVWGNVVGSVASVTAGVTVTTNNDKTGYALSAAGVDAVWDEATAGHVTAGTYGVAVSDILVDTAEIGAAGAGLTNINLPNQTMDIVGNITGNLSGSVGSVTGAVGSVTGNVGGNVTGSVGSVAAGGIAAASFAAGAIDAAAIAANAIGASELAADAVAEIADAVWDEALAGHTTAGSAGKALSDAGTAGDPWSTAVPGAYGAGTAGFLLGTNLDATVSSRLATAGYTAPLDAAGTRTAVGLASANLDTQLAALPTGDENADALLGRNVSGGSSTGRTVKQALHVLRNKSVIGAGTLTVYDTDDTTTSFTASVTTAAGDPISGIDPA